MVTWLYPTCSKGHQHFSLCSRGQELPVSPDQTATAGSELKGGLTNTVASVKLQKIIVLPKSRVLYQGFILKPW